MPLYAHSEIRSGQTVVAKYGDTISAEQLKQLGNGDQLKEAGIISEEKPGPQLTDMPAAAEGEEEV